MHRKIQHADVVERDALQCGHVCADALLQRQLAFDLGIRCERRRECLADGAQLKQLGARGGNFRIDRGIAVLDKIPIAIDRYAHSHSGNDVLRDDGLQSVIDGLPYFGVLI